MGGFSLGKSRGCTAEPLRPLSPGRARRHGAGGGTGTVSPPGSRRTSGGAAAVGCHHPTPQTPPGAADRRGKSPTAAPRAGARRNSLRGAEREPRCRRARAGSHGNDKRDENPATPRQPGTDRVPHSPFPGATPQPRRRSPPHSPRRRHGPSARPLPSVVAAAAARPTAAPRNRCLLLILLLLFF